MLRIRFPEYIRVSKNINQLPKLKKSRLSVLAILIPIKIVFLLNNKNSRNHKIAGKEFN